MKLQVLIKCSITNIRGQTQAATPNDDIVTDSDSDNPTAIQSESMPFSYEQSRKNIAEINSKRNQMAMQLKAHCILPIYKERFKSASSQEILAKDEAQ